jgi:phosphoesterase RecJ-like protein
MKRYIDNDSVREFRRLVTKAGNVLIISHINPDGDAVGSVSAVKSYLFAMGIHSTVILPNRYPDYLEFLDNKDPFKIYSENPGEIIKLADSADLIIAVDFNKLERVDELESHILSSKADKILIDHHPHPDRENFSLIISQTEVSSTCELLFWLFKEIEDECGKIDKDVAVSLYTGMMTDTNNFSNSVSSSTFLMASDLLDRGVDKEYLQHMVFGGFSVSRMRLMGHVLLNKMVIIPDYGASYIVLTKKEMESFGFSEGDSEGFVNMPLNIKGVNIAALFTETDSHIRVSLRSADDFSVNRLSALHFNGGGHERAAGGKLYIPVEKAGEYFEKSLRESFLLCKGVKAEKSQE